ncbi:MAG: MarR family transcriptional regulator [Firmicutes bacterium]|mgnify:FL=1|nr:MarR family transcriptional regulator [Candidatus Fermentithermobacillaceae bacterium]HON87731.1 MarR family transcriptional regulator [Bacillota bacterium]HOV66125.1 MarR family transcriptional regulator [Bacillota bacterium]HRC53379.1 MarR family transcriptional regulator [Bacillota bacterium]
MSSQVCSESVAEIERLLRHVSFIIKRRGRDILKDFDITTPQFLALQVLRDEPGITMGELCEKLFLACSTATDLVDRMEKNGYVNRQRDLEDRRVIRLFITEKGEEIIHEVILARRRYVEQILKQLSAEEIEQLATSLEKLHSLMHSENV